MQVDVKFVDAAYMYSLCANVALFTGSETIMEPVSRNRIDRQPYAFNFALSASRWPLVSPIALLSALPADLAEKHGGEEADVPGDEIKPELVLDARTLGEVCQVGSNRFSERGKERGVTVRFDRDAGGNRPSKKCEKVNSNVRLEPVIIEGFELTANGLRGSARRRGAQRTRHGHRLPLNACFKRCGMALVSVLVSINQRLTASSSTTERGRDVQRF